MTEFESWILIFYLFFFFRVQRAFQNHSHSTTKFTSCLQWKTEREDLKIFMKWYLRSPLAIASTEVKWQSMINLFFHISGLHCIKNNTASCSPGLLWTTAASKEGSCELFLPELSASRNLPQQRCLLHCFCTFSFIAQWNTNINKPATKANKQQVKHVFIDRQTD